MALSDSPDDVQARRVRRQREVGAEIRRATRRRIVLAAADEFEESGYVGATVARIARRAGVAVPTLYASWGSKRELLKAVMMIEVTGDETGYHGDRTVIVLSPALDEPITDGAAYMALVAHSFRVIAERSALAWTTYRDAAGADPEVATDWQAVQMDRFQTFTEVMGKLPPHLLQQGLTLEDAIDTTWTIVSPETHELLVIRLGWPYDRYENWLATTLTAALIAAPAPPPSRRRRSS